LVLEIGKLNEIIVRRKLFVAIGGLIILAIFSPYMLANQGLNRTIIAASTWSIITIENNWMLVVPPLVALPVVAVILLPRILFVYTIWGFYTNRNQEGTFSWGIILILSQLLIPCVYYYFNPFYIEFPGENDPFISRPGPGVGELICIPIPILLCTGLILLGYWKPQLNTSNQM
jgi:hypothetical protein